MAKQHNIFFVCTANICRSPMAEGLLREMAKERQLSITVRSGGTMGLREKPAAKNAIKVMAEIKIDISNHKCAGVSQDDIDWADHILVMEGKHASKLRHRFPDADLKILILANFGGMIQIDDPVGGWKRRFRRSRNDIQKCIEGFLRQLPAIDAMTNRSQ